MLQDYEHELTTAGGQAVTATAYGTKPYDQKAAADAGVGEPLSMFFQITTADLNNATSYTIELYGDDDGAGTNEVAVLSKSYALAALTVALGIRRVGIVPPGTRKKFYRAKWTRVGGSDSNQGKIVAWLAKGSDVGRANAAGTI